MNNSLIFPEPEYHTVFYMNHVLTLNSIQIRIQFSALHMSHVIYYQVLYTNQNTTWYYIFV